MDADVNIMVASVSGSQHDHAPYEDSNNQTEGEVTSEHPTDHIAEHGHGNPYKVVKTDLETGSWNCKNGLCNAEDDDDMFSCTKCNGWYHYRCTNLPPYQVALFLMKGHRGYRCASCVKVNEVLVQKCGPYTKAKFE